MNHYNGHPYKKKGNLGIGTQKKQCHVKVEIEIGVVIYKLRNAKSCQPSVEARYGDRE